MNLDIDVILAISLGQNEDLERCGVFFPHWDTDHCKRVGMGESEGKGRIGLLDSNSFTVKPLYNDHLSYCDKWSLKSHDFLILLIVSTGST